MMVEGYLSIAFAQLQQAIAENTGFRAYPETLGTGTGLRHIKHHLGIDVAVESDGEGQGATIHLRLPVEPIIE